MGTATQKSTDVRQVETCPDSPILEYLRAIGIETVENYLRYRLGWRQLDDTHWARSEKTSGIPSGQVCQGVNGQWGVTIKTSGDPRLKQSRWYSLPALYTAWEHGGDWAHSDGFVRLALASLRSYERRTATKGFKLFFSDFDKQSMTDRSAAIWCYERLEGFIYVAEHKEWRVWNGSAWVPAGQQVFEAVTRIMLDVSTEHGHFAHVEDQAAKAKLEAAWTKFHRRYLKPGPYKDLKKCLENFLAISAHAFDGDFI